MTPDALAELHEASGLSSDLRVQPVLLLPRLKVICSHERPLPPHRGRGHGWAAWQSLGEERKRIVRVRKEGEDRRRTGGRVREESGAESHLSPPVLDEALGVEAAHFEEGGCARRLHVQVACDLQGPAGRRE